MKPVYIEVREGKSASVREYENGKMFADYDDYGELLGIEILEFRGLSNRIRLSPDKEMPQLPISTELDDKVTRAFQ